MIIFGNYDYLWNIFILFIGAFVALFVSLATEKRSVMVIIGAVFVSVSLIITFLQNFGNVSIEGGPIFLSGFSKLFSIAILVPGLLSVIGMAKSPLSKKPGLMVFIFLISLGFMLLAITTYNLLFIFVAFEGVSIPTYVLTAYGKSDSEMEAAIKYFIIGAFSTGLIIFGISLYYIATGSLSLGAIPSFHSIYFLAIGLLVFGFGFKLAIFPLHGWAIDTYTGTSNPVSSYLSTSSKIMTLIVLFNIMFTSPLFFNYLKILFAIIAILTMTFGNVVAISQNNVKRMLAYSSIAQAGYLSIVFLVAGTGAVKLAVLSLFMYALAYGFMKAGSFLAMDSMGNYDIENFSGMWKRNPAFAISFAILLLSLAGFPGTLGFIGKYFLFLSVLSTGTPLAYLVVIISVINSVVSFYYYGRVIIYMFWREGVKEKIANNYLLYSSAFFTVLFGVLYFLVFSYAQSIFPSLITYLSGGI
ncbi:MAG: NADH-quinone oxidoreductase subunit N [Thermoplasmatales archaeon]